MAFRNFLPLVIRISLCLLAIVWSQPVQAQFGFDFGRIGVVGGVSVDANGMVRSVSLEDRSELLRQLRTSVQSPTGPVAENVPLRMISLSRLQARVAQAIADQQPLTDDILYLAGLQRVEYIFVYPDAEAGAGDIVIAGPAEPWTVRDDTSVVGRTSGRPVLRLEDLLVALRTAEVTQNEVISVSIDPTPEGELRLQSLLSRIGTGDQFNPSVAEPAMKEAFGPQRVSLTAVPKSSRMAQVLVAADFEMKRLAMNLESSPIKELPSYMEMIRNSGARKGVQPRWWMTCQYDSIQHSQDRLAWKISGPSVKTLTEDQRIAATGQRVGTGKANQQAQQWADQFTSRFDQLCVTNSVFGDLQNAMDLNIVAAIIKAHQLQELANCELALLCGADSSQLETPVWHVPQWLEPQCSFIRGRSGWTVSASGGVEINPWRIVAQASSLDQQVSALRQEVPAVIDSWWWDR